jgi:hypothetical protein
VAAALTQFSALLQHSSQHVYLAILTPQLVKGTFYAAVASTHVFVAVPVNTSIVVLG